jgi:hypothetical protein
LSPKGLVRAKVLKDWDYPLKIKPFEVGPLKNPYQIRLLLGPLVGPLDPTLKKSSPTLEDDV